MTYLRDLAPLGGVLALWLAACGTPSGNEGGSGGAGGMPGDPWMPIGTYHFAPSLGTKSLTAPFIRNLELDANGTFRTGYYEADGGGTWESLGDRLVLYPEPGSRWWIDFPGANIWSFAEFEELEVVQGEAPGELIISGVHDGEAYEASSGDTPYDIRQRWVPGGLCPVLGECGERAEPCDSPPGLRCSVVGRTGEWCDVRDPPFECRRDEDCNDDDRCTTDRCDRTDGRCARTPVICDDFNECTTQDVCAPGDGCAEPLPVADGTPCTGGTCNEGRCQLGGDLLPCTDHGIRNAIAAGGGPYTFDCDGPTTIETAAQLLIGTEVDLDGEGLITLDGGGRHRVIRVEEGATAALRGITITGGNGVGEADEDQAGHGGGILSFGTLALDECNVSDNRADIGGGVWNFGDLTVSRTAIRGNRVDFFGGGIANQGHGVLRMTDSVVSENRAGGDPNPSRAFEEGAGGLLNLSGTVTLERCEISSNSGRFGGGVYNTWDAALSMVDTTVAGNQADVLGGGIVNEGEMLVSGCTVSGNAAGTSGGGLSNGGDLTITNSTVSGNQVERTCSPYDGHGGGIADRGNLTLVSTTLAGNRAANEGSALHTWHGVVFSNTLIEGDCAPLEGLADSEWTSSLGHNVESPGDTCDFDQSSDQTEVPLDDLELGPLADNGGPTETHALGAGSVAVDVVPGDECVDGEGILLENDQRGEPRDLLCDVGAFELQR